MKLHRALTLVVMMLVSLVLIALMAVYAVATFSPSSLLALGIVVLAAAAGGVGFSYRRYFGDGARVRRAWVVRGNGARPARDLPPRQ